MITSSQDNSFFIYFIAVGTGAAVTGGIKQTRKGEKRKSSDFCESDCRGEP